MLPCAPWKYIVLMGPWMFFHHQADLAGYRSALHAPALTQAVVLSSGVGALCKWSTALCEYTFPLDDVPTPERCVATSWFGVAFFGILLYGVSLGALTLQRPNVISRRSWRPSSRPPSPPTL
eukprot:697011-Pyramimonas_sp.AAC.1